MVTNGQREEINNRRSLQTEWHHESPSLSSSVLPTLLQPITATFLFLGGITARKWSSLIHKTDVNHRGGTRGITDKGWESQVLLLLPATQICFGDGDYTRGPPRPLLQMEIFLRYYPSAGRSPRLPSRNKLQKQFYDSQISCYLIRRFSLTSNNQLKRASVRLLLD